eukprot:8189717-Alexandrium_andersonii.AAC.1
MALGSRLKLGTSHQELALSIGICPLDRCGLADHELAAEGRHHVLEFGLTGHDPAKVVFVRSPRPTAIRLDLCYQGVADADGGGVLRLEFRRV